MAKTFRLMVLTPEREFFNGDAAYVGVNTIAGSIGVLADHIPMVSALDVGTLTIRAQDGGARTAFHSEGFIEVRADGVYVLCQACEWPEEIDEKRALEAEHRPAEDAQVFKRNRVALMRALTRRKIKSMSSINTR
jgi:F-type H+-transporting ATPase subunit epsilon